MIIAMVSLTACASCTTENDGPIKGKPETESEIEKWISELGITFNKDNNMDYSKFPLSDEKKRTGSDNTPEQRLRYADCRSGHLQSDRRGMR